MITVISGTNRRDSFTEGVARIYAELVEAHGGTSQVLTLRELPADVASGEMYKQRTDEMSALIEKYLSGVDKFVFIVPEYNGSYPGILKLFLDVVPPRIWKDKKAAIIGVSSGHAGNLRGLEHLTGILHYLKLFVHYDKPKLSAIEGLLDDERRLVDAAAVKKLEEHAGLIVQW